MDRLCIRHSLEEKAREIGGHIEGGGFSAVPPFEMDFVFNLDGKRYEVTLVDLEEKRKARENPSDEESGIAEIGGLL